MRRRSVVVVVLMMSAGCGGGPALKVGDEVALRKSGAADGKGLIPVDEDALIAMGKTPSEFAKVFDEFVSQKRLLLERDGARGVVLETKVVGRKAARIRITEGLNPGREAWCPASELDLVTKR